MRTEKKTIDTLDALSMAVAAPTVRKDKHRQRKKTANQVITIDLDEFRVK